MLRTVIRRLTTTAPRQGLQIGLEGDHSFKLKKTTDSVSEILERWSASTTVREQYELLENLHLINSSTKHEFFHLRISVLRKTNLSFDEEDWIYIYTFRIYPTLF